MTTLLVSAGMLIIEILLAFVLPTIERQFQGMFAQMPFMQTMMKALLGTDVGPEFGMQGIQALAWVHPVVLALVWAHGIIISTRLPAGEIDRGTADVLFGLPVSRWNVYGCEGAVWLISFAVVMLAALAGHRIGGIVQPTDAAIPTLRLFFVLLNLYCLGVAVGSIGWLMSALGDRRGRAMAVVFGIVVASFLLNFIAQFWAPAEKVMFLGLLNYYRPAEIIRTGTCPVSDAAVLLSFSGVSWTMGGMILSRRDIATV